VKLFFINFSFINSIVRVSLFKSLNFLFIAASLVFSKSILQYRHIHFEKSIFLFVIHFSSSSYIWAAGFVECFICSRKMQIMEHVPISTMLRIIMIVPDTIFDFLPTNSTLQQGVYWCRSNHGMVTRIVSFQNFGYVQSPIVHSRIRLKYVPIFWLGRILFVAPPIQSARVGDLFSISIVN